ncbi:MAG: DUF2520 domain-containing protein [Microthrixaceae bacterium]
MNSPTGALRTVVVGSGRAGGSFAEALRSAGWQVDLVHHDEVASLDVATLAADLPVGSGADDPVQRAAVDLDVPAPRGDAAPDGVLVLLCVPDAHVAATAASLVPAPGSLVAHCAGSLGLDVLGDHRARASVHPLVAMPDTPTGARRLRGAWFAVSGDPRIRRVVDALGGTAVEVPDERRVAYHAAAVVASNHLVALLGEVERLAAVADVPLDAYLDLVRMTVDNVDELGPAAALTGPVSRRDWTTVRAHAVTMSDGDRAMYLDGVKAVAALARVDLPDDLGTGR